MKIFEYLRIFFDIAFKFGRIILPLGIIVIGAYHVQEKGNEIPSIIFMLMGGLLLFLIHVPIKEKKTDSNYKPEQRRF